MAVIPLLTLEVRSEPDVVQARQRARQIADGLGFDLQGQTRLGTAVSEIVRNAQRYAGGGRVQFSFLDEAAQALAVEVSDRGPGIAHLDAVLDGSYRSETGMGMGIVGARRLMDDFTIEAPTGKGTVVRLVKHVPRRAGRVDLRQLSALARSLAAGLPGDATSEVQRQNQELLRTLEELESRQQELVSLNRELEDTNRGVVALYAELDSRAVFLRRASDIKSRFLSNMTHEFRTPLNSILALSNLLLERADGPLTPEQEKQVSFIRRSADQLGELVNDLLDLAKVEAGKVSVKSAEFRVDDLFGALKGMLKPLLAPNASVSLVFEDPTGIAPLATDEGKVSQVLRNLISNALKFTERGEVRVSARALGSDRVAFAVADTGIGIAPESMELIFQEFGQVEHAQRQGVRGTGLGLPLSRRLAELLGGTVRVESRLGQGSTFTLELPLRYQGRSEGGLVHDPERRDATPGAQRAQMPRVLIIDDDEVSRYLLRGILPRGLEVSEAAGGVEGVAAARRLLPRVVFLDLEMPDLPGEQVLANLRGDEATAVLPVIIYTSQPTEVARQRVRGGEGSVVAVVSKRSASRDEAEAAIRAALRQAGIEVPA